MSEKKGNTSKPTRAENNASEGKKTGIIKKIKSSKSAAVGAVVVAIVAILIVAFGIFIGYAASYQEIFPNVSVNGINVGGLTVEEAASKLESDFVPTVEGRSVLLICGDNSKEVTFEELKVEADGVAMAEQAFEYGRSGNIFRKTFDMIGAVFGGKKLTGDVKYDEELLDKIIADLAGDNETKMEETSYSVENDVLTITKGHGGRQVDRVKADAMLKNAVADESVSELVFVIEELDPSDINVDKFYEELTQPARDAQYKLVDGKVIVEKGIPQVIVDKKEVKKAFESNQPQVSIKVKTVQPKVTAGELSALLFRDVLGSYSSNFGSSTEARANNVELTAKRINNYVLMPGDVFSYDKTVKSRTVANGYKSAGVYVGNRVESGIGGGICQTSSTLYSAVLYSNLEIVERTSHSLPVSYIPDGMDATIAEGSIDFKFKNNTNYPIKIVASAVNRKLVCEIYGVKVPGQSVEVVSTRTGTISPKVTKTTSADIPAGYKKVVSNGASGYTVATQRIVKQDGKVVKTEKLTGSVYNAKNIEIIVNPADAGAEPEGLSVYTDGMVIEPEEDEGENTEGEETADKKDEGENAESGSSGAEEKKPSGETSDKTSSNGETESSAAKSNEE